MGKATNKRFDRFRWETPGISAGRGVLTLSDVTLLIVQSLLLGGDTYESGGALRVFDGLLPFLKHDSSSSSLCN